MKFANEQDAAHAMLLEVTSLFNRQTIDYAVIGGWVPYLFNNAPLPHPGTFDVDIVLNNALRKDAVVATLDELVSSSGYIRAPKNAFQIYRILHVVDEQMIFHVDFLHRKYADDTDNLIMQWGRYETIQTPGTDTLFLNKEVRHQTLNGPFPNGASSSVRIPFATEAGFLACKGRSVGFGKRTRDAYDVFLILDQSQDRDALIHRCKELLNEPVFRKSMERLAEQFHEGVATTQAAEWLLKMAPERLPGEPAGDPKDPKTEFVRIEMAKGVICETVDGFLNDIGMGYGYVSPNAE